MSDQDNALARKSYWIACAEDLALMCDEDPHPDYYNERMLSFVLLDAIRQVGELQALVEDMKRNRR